MATCNWELSWRIENKCVQTIFASSNTLPLCVKILALAFFCFVGVMEYLSETERFRWRLKVFDDAALKYVKIIFGYCPSSKLQCVFTFICNLSDGQSPKKTTFTDWTSLVYRVYVSKWWHVIVASFWRQVLCDPRCLRFLHVCWLHVISVKAVLVPAISQGWCSPQSGWDSPDSKSRPLHSSCRIVVDSVLHNLQNNEN